MLKFNNLEQKKSFDHVIAPNSVRDKIPFFEGLTNSFKEVKNDETEMQSIDGSFASLEFDQTSVNTREKN